MNEPYSCDNSGNRCAPTPYLSDPIAASGIVTTLSGTPGNNSEITVEGGCSYTVIVGLASSAVVGEVTSFSITGTAATDINKEWNVALGDSIVIHIPMGKTTLNAVSTLASALVYMSKLNL